VAVESPANLYSFCRKDHGFELKEKFGKTAPRYLLAGVEAASTGFGPVALKNDP